MDARTQERARLIRNATPDVLENLFEMSNRICDLCGHEIQDLICAALDHSTPVIYFARSTMPIEEAIAQANDPRNLRCAHASCNTAKNGLTREDWYRRGLNDREVPRFLTDGQLLELQFRLGAGGRNRSIAKLTALRVNSTGVSKGGHIGGRKNVESGHMARMQTHANRAAGGRISGPKTARNKTGIHGRSSEQMAADGRKGGRIGGRITGRKFKEEGLGLFAVQNQGIGPHTRWHVNRGVVNPNCDLCQKQQSVAA